jgi:hypothetical protein
MVGLTRLYVKPETAGRKRPKSSTASGTDYLSFGGQRTGLPPRCGSAIGLAVSQIASRKIWAGPQSARRDELDETARPAKIGESPSNGDS